MDIFTMLSQALPCAWSTRFRLCRAISSLPCPSGTALNPHILTSGTAFMACMNTNAMSKTYPAETATTAVGFARLGRPFSRSISQPAIGKICNAWIPKKCATLKSPPVVLQLSTGSPGPPGATPHTLSLRHHHRPDDGSCKEKEKPECDPELR